VVSIIRDKEAGYGGMGNKRGKGSEKKPAPQKRRYGYRQPYKGMDFPGKAAKQLFRENPPKRVFVK
jgi:hypothetical protein